MNFVAWFFEVRGSGGGRWELDEACEPEDVGNGQKIKSAPAQLSGVVTFVGDGAAGGGHCAEFLEEGIPAVLGQCAQDLLLQVEGNGPELAVDAAARGFEADAAGAPVMLVGVTLHPAVSFHALDQRGHGVGIATHEFGQPTLGEADALAFGEVAHDNELVGSDAEVGDPAAEGLIEAVPGVAQEDGKTFLGIGEVGVRCRG